MENEIKSFVDPLYESENLVIDVSGDFDCDYYYKNNKWNVVLTEKNTGSSVYLKYNSIKEAEATIKAFNQTKKSEKLPLSPTKIIVFLTAVIAIGVTIKKFFNRRKLK